MRSTLQENPANKTLKINHHLITTKNILLTTIVFINEFIFFHLILYSKDNKFLIQKILSLLIRSGQLMFKNYCPRVYVGVTNWKRVL